MSKKNVKSVGIMSVASTIAIVGIVWGLIYGVFALVAGFELSGIGEGAGALVMVFGPIAGAIGGFIGGAISAVMYNIAAKVTDGFELELE